MKNTPKQLSRWRSIIPFQLQEKDKETPKGVSMTVPDLHTDLKSILERFTKGEIIKGFGEPVEGTEGASFDDIDMQEFQRLDITEKTYIIEQTNLLIEDAKQQYAARKKASKQGEEGA